MVKLKRSAESLPPPGTNAQPAPQKRGVPWRTLGRVATVAGAVVLLAGGQWAAQQQPDTDPEIQQYWTAVTHGLGKEGEKPSLPLHEAEELYLKQPSNESLFASSQKYTAHAHPAGSGWDFVTALQVKNDWERALGLPITGPTENIFEAGSKESQHALREDRNLSVWIDTYFPVMNTPVSTSVALLTKPVYHPQLREARLDGDPYSELADEVRAFHGLSVSGHVMAPYIYAGYGRKIDFDLLVEKGVNFTDKIVLVKYGGVFRGLKVKAAQEAGAAAVVIFTDPGDDGDIQETKGHKAYPDGPARVPSSVQRGSVQFLSKYPGDPTTPGEPAYKNASRVEGGNFPSIPSIPMSYEDVIPILRELNGHGLSPADLDESFDGGLRHKGVEYFTGPSKVALHLTNKVNTRVMPVWNVMARIPGHLRETVVMGNHRDAWVLGASDPNAGTASQTEMAKGLGTLLRKGWKPLRSVLLASWDAEEYGLIGSTEFAEDFGDWIQATAVAYLNLDSSVSGQHFHAGASPSLAGLIRRAAQRVQRGNASVWDTRLAEHTVHSSMKPLSASAEAASVAALGLARPQSEAAGGTGVRPLGSGSDYTAFLQRYGVASTDFGYGSSLQAPVYHYHSVYDNLHWMRMYGDPLFAKHTEAAQILGLLTLSLAGEVILPLNTTQYCADLAYYYEQVAQLRDESGLKIELKNLAAAVEHLTHASHWLDIQRADLLKRLRKALGTKEGSGSWGAATVSALSSFAAFLRGKPGRELEDVLRDIAEVNARLRKFESGFLHKNGIPERDWYKHLVVAPGKWLGYGATTFPALTEAIIYDKDALRGQFQADVLSGLLNGLAIDIARPLSGQ